MKVKVVVSMKYSDYGENYASSEEQEITEEDFKLFNKHIDRINMNCNYVYRLEKIVDILPLEKLIELARIEEYKWREKNLKAIEKQQAENEKREAKKLERELATFRKLQAKFNTQGDHTER